MKQCVKMIAIMLVVYLGINVNVYAFDCSVSKDYAKGNMTVSGACQADDTISVIIMTSGITPESAWTNISDENKTTYNHHYYSNGTQYSITASGGCPSDIAFVSDVKANEKGEFKIEAGIEESGTYDIYVTSKKEKETKIIENIDFVDNDVYGDAVDALNNEAQNGDTVSFLTILKDKLSDLSFDTIDIAEVDISAVSYVLFNEIKSNPLAKDDFENNLITYKNCVVSALLNKKQVTDITDNIKEIITQDRLHQYYDKNITETAHRLYFTSKMSEKNITTIQELKELCTEAIILTVVKYPNGYMNIKEILSEIGEEKGISPLSNNNSVYSNLAGGNYNSVDDLITVYKNNVKNVSSSSGSSGSSSGSSGSGGSSGSSSGSGKNTSSSMYIPGRTEQSNNEVKNMKFIDLDTVMWAYEAISTLSDKNIISGKSEDRFAPNDNITREEFVKLVIAVLNEEITANSAGFTDVNAGAWYSGYVNRACEIGIVNGFEDGSFGVGEKITRQDIAVILNNALKYKAVEVQKGNLSFTDNSNISGYAEEAVAVLSTAGIIGGYDDGSFRPKSYATRAEAAQLIFKMLNVLR